MTVTLSNLLDNTYAGFTGSRGFSGSKGDSVFVSWSVKTTNYTAQNFDGIIADTTLGSFTITLPATPSTGDIVIITDGADWGIFPLTVARNGSTIEGQTNDFVLDVSQSRVDFIYDGTTWHIYTNTGPQGAIGFTGSRGFTGSKGDVGKLNWTVRTSNYTAKDLDGVVANTSGGSFTVSLPLIPSTGTLIVITDGADWGTFPLTVARNGSTIEGQSNDFVLDVSQTRVDFVYDGTTWQVYSNTGPQGSLGFTGSRGFTGFTGSQGPAGGFTGSKGDTLTGIPPSTNTTVVLSDSGKYLNVSSNVTINTSTGFSSGDVVSIYNNSVNNISITASGVTLRLAGTATTGNRILAQYGLVTILCVGTNDYVISGAGLS